MPNSVSSKKKSGSKSDSKSRSKSNSYTRFRRKRAAKTLQRTFRKALSQGICAICAGSMFSTSNIKPLNCGHKFHNECIAAWLKVNNICPTCRRVQPNPTGTRINTLVNDRTFGNIPLSMQ
jgi:hypothetical protein